MFVARNQHTELLTEGARFRMSETSGVRAEDLYEIHLSEQLYGFFCLVFSDHQPGSHWKGDQSVSRFSVKIKIDTGIIECCLNECHSYLAGDSDHFDELVELGLRFWRQLVDECDLAIIANLEALPVFRSTAWTVHISLSTFEAHNARNHLKSTA
jgi:hypothetical protein